MDGLAECVKEIPHPEKQNRKGKELKKKRENQTSIQNLSNRSSKEKE